MNMPNTPVQQWPRQVPELMDECSALSDAPDADARYLCSVEEAARIVGQKWTLQIVNVLMDFGECRFCVLQEALGGVNPSTLSARLKRLEEAHPPVPQV